MRSRLALSVVALMVAAATGSHAAVAARADTVARFEPLSAGDAAAIRTVIEAYRSAWLRGDARGVLDTLTPDAVLLPAHGAAPIVGTAAITRYWWPAGAPPAKVTRLDITVDGLEGGGDFASAYGRDDVEWTQVENGATRSHGHPGTYLDVMRRQADGTWRISRHMWDDGPSH